jgi:hypothetical protein
LLRARSPSYGLPCSAPRTPTVMRTNRHLLPTASTTSTRALSVPSISSKLSLRPWRIGLHPQPRDWETRHFTMPDLLRWVVRIHAWHSLRSTSEQNRTSDTPVASLRPSLRFHACKFCKAAETAEQDPPLKRRPVTAVRGDFHRRVTPALPRKPEPISKSDHVMSSAPIRPSTPIHTQPLRCAFDARSLATG